MTLRQISDEEMRETLHRAQEIAQQPALGDEQFELFIQAAEEIGISREAMLQAMRERRLVPEIPFKPGDFVFAPSDDRCFYAAVVLNVFGSTVAVQFIRGGERTYAQSEVQPVSLLPGSKVQYKYPNYGWISTQVNRYDPLARTLFLTSPHWWQEAEISLSQVRLAPPKTAQASSMQQLALKIAIAAGTGGTLLGFLLGHFLH